MQRLASIILYLSIVVVALSGAALGYMFFVDAPGAKLEATRAAPTSRASAPASSPAPAAAAVTPVPERSAASPSASTSATASEPEREYRPVWIAPTTKYRESALPPVPPDKAGEPAPPAEIATGEEVSSEISQEARNQNVERIQERPHNLEIETPAPPPPPPAAARPQTNFESPFHRDTNQ